jgi:ABC-2 type transport system permease protein
LSRAELKDIANEQARLDEAREEELRGMAPPASTGGLVDVFKRRYVLKLLVRREISARYQGSILGILWSYIQPLTRFLMYYFVIGMVIGLDRGVEQFGIHVFTGMVFIHYFTETFTAGTRAIVRNAGIVKKMALPREMFPVASMLVSAYHTIPGIAILLVACTVVGFQPDTVGVLAGLLGFSLVAVLGTALALLFSAANVFARDFSNVVQTLNQFIHLAVPMIYPYTLVASRFGAEHVGLYLANPLSVAVLLLQRCFWIPTTSDPASSAITQMPDHLFTRGLIMLVISLVALFVAQLVFSRLENKFPERL